MTNKRNKRNTNNFKKQAKKRKVQMSVDEMDTLIKKKTEQAAQQFIQTIEPEVECKTHGIHNRYMELAMKGDNGENIELYYCMDCLTKVLDKTIGRMEVNKERRLVKKKINSEEDIGLIDPMTLPSEELSEEEIASESKEIFNELVVEENTPEEDEVNNESDKNE